MIRVVRKTLGMSPTEAAAYWVVVHDRGDLSDSEQVEFDDWMAEPSHAEAFAKAHDALDVFDLDDGSDPHLRALRQAALEMPPPHRRRWLISGSLAASIAAVITFMVWTSHTDNASEPTPTIVAEQSTRSTPAASPAAATTQRRDPTDIRTGIGERRTVRLTDGSSVTLNTNSRMTVAFTEGRRLVRLVKGQALFEVAHNPDRPFVVEAADRQVTALGTVFEVRVDPGRMSVVLVQGRVAIDRSSETPSESLASVAPAILTPGQQFVAELGTAQVVAPVDVSRQLLWRDGFVEFDDEPLGRAVAEFNRYTPRPIVLADDGVAALRVSGVFRTGSPDRFVNTVAEILPVEARPTREGRIELSLQR